MTFSTVLINVRAKRLKIIRKVIIKPESQEIIRNGKNLNDGTETAIINRCP